MKNLPFDPVDAAFAGVSEIRANPRQFLIWAGILSVPTFVLTLIVVAIFAALAAVFASFGGEVTDIADVGGNMITGVLALLAIPFITATGMKILGKLRGKTWHGLRLGKDEFLMLGVFLLYYGASAAVTGAMVLVGALLFGLGYLVGGVVAGSILAVLYSIGCVVVLCWLGLRLCLVIPASLDGGTIVIRDAWNRSKGQCGRLLGTYLLTCLLSMVIYVVSFIVAAIIGGILFGLGYVAYEAAGWMAALPFGLIGGVVGCVLFTTIWLAVYLIGYGPLFDVWKSIKQTSAPNGANDQMTSI